MKLEAGKTYLNRMGERVTVLEIETGTAMPFFGAPYWYTPGGRLYTFMESPNDLIAEAPEEIRPVKAEHITDDTPWPFPLYPAPEPPAKRKIVQFELDHDVVFALSDDGIMWRRSRLGCDKEWLQLPEIPQP
jgi:hypothetical protein